MKCTLVLSLALFALVSSDEFYSKEVDSLDINAITNDINQLQAFVDCFIRAKCNEQFSTLQKILEESVQQACAKCSKLQKHILSEFLKAFQNKLPEDFQTFKAKYDPEGKYLEPLYSVISKA